MTESQWLSSCDPAAMMEVVRKDRQRVKSGPGWDNYYVASDRKLRLFAVACCRQVWHLLTDERSRLAVEVAERYADEEATEEERVAAYEDARMAWNTRNNPAGMAVYCCSTNIEYGTSRIVIPELKDTPNQNILAALLREIVGNPYVAHFLCCSVKVGRQLPLDNKCPVCGPILTWNDGTVPRIAQSIYDRRAFEEMPILVDPLMEAGCDNEAILQHCRGMERCWDHPMIDGGCPNCDEKVWRPLRSPHVRGCWVLDLLLGKE